MWDPAIIQHKQADVDKAIESKLGALGRDRTLVLKNDTLVGYLKSLWYGKLYELKWPQIELKLNSLCWGRGCGKRLRRIYIEPQRDAHLDAWVGLVERRSKRRRENYQLSVRTVYLMKRVTLTKFVWGLRSRKGWRKQSLLMFLLTICRRTFRD